MAEKTTSDEAQAQAQVVTPNTATVAVSDRAVPPEPVTGWSPLLQPNGNADEPVQAPPGAADEHGVAQEVQTQRDGEQQAANADGGDGISWRAAEFLAHQKSAGWYGMLVVGAIMAAAIVYLLTRDVISAGVIIVAAFFFGIAASRQPQEVQYMLNSRGVQIGDKYYSLSGFRSFAVVPEGALSSIVLMPLKRFSPLRTIYFSPEHESELVNVLSETLPLEDFRHDAFEQFLHRIHF